MSTLLTGQVQVQINSTLYEPECVVQEIQAIQGPVDIYCWYEGPKCLPETGAAFMKKRIFQPLYQAKKDAKLYLYSLKAWNFEKNLSAMQVTTKLGNTINSVNKVAVECIYSSSFFQYCTQLKRENPLCTFINEKVPNKKWLLQISETVSHKGKTIEQLFEETIPPVTEGFEKLDVNTAYSFLQYIEGYYLVRTSVEKALQQSQKKVEIAFVLPNDEYKYYRDFPCEVKDMLTLDFGERLSSINVNISFRSFLYGNGKNERPYLCGSWGNQVPASKGASYFDYALIKQDPLVAQQQKEEKERIKATKTRTTERQT